MIDAVAISTPSRPATFRDGVVACGPTMLGYWSIGFAAGAIGALAGFSLPQIAMLSGLLYAGSAQFMFYSLHAAEAGLLPIVFGVLLVNMRYLLMSSYLAMFFRNKSLLEKFVGGFLLTDETFGVAALFAQRHRALPLRWLLGLNLSAYVNWIVANLAGAVSASAMPAGVTRGLSFSLVAMFIGLLLAAWFASRDKWLDLLAAATSAAVIWLGFGRVDPNIGVLAAAVLAASIATVVSRSRARERRP